MQKHKTPMIAKSLTTESKVKHFYQLCIIMYIPKGNKNYTNR